MEFAIASLVLVIVLLAFEPWRWLGGRKSRPTAPPVDPALQPDHVFHEVRAEDFPWLTRSYYDEAQRDLEADGFKWLADIEDATISSLRPDERTFVRVCLSPDRKTHARICEVAPGGPQGKVTRALVQTCEMVSEASDRSSLVTTTALPNKVPPAPEGEVRHHLPPLTRLSVMRSSHEGTIAEYLAGHPGVSLVEASTVVEITHFWQKRIDRERAHVRGQAKPKS